MDQRNKEKEKLQVHSQDSVLSPTSSISAACSQQPKLVPTISGFSQLFPLLTVLAALFRDAVKLDDEADGLHLIGLAFPFWPWNVNGDRMYRLPPPYICHLNIISTHKNTTPYRPTYSFLASEAHTLANLLNEYRSTLVLASHSRGLESFALRYPLPLLATHNPWSPPPFDPSAAPSPLLALRD